MESVDFNVDWCSKSKLRGPGEQSLGNLMTNLRNRLSPEAQGVSLTYLDDRAMRKLNSEHRGINRTTDVLSFPANPEKGEYQHLGDIVICLPVADEHAKKLGVSRRRVVETLVIHGFLHLCGYDHETDQGEMMALQATLEREFLDEEALPMSLRRGRKPGSKVKQLKDGSRVVVTGRAAKALTRRDAEQKAKKADKAKGAEPEALSPSGSKKPAPRKAEAPRKAKAAEAAATPAKRTPRKKKAVRPRTGVIA